MVNYCEVPSEVYLVFDGGAYHSFYKKLLSLYRERLESILKEEIYEVLKNIGAEKYTEELTKKLVKNFVRSIKLMLKFGKYTSLSYVIKQYPFDVEMENLINNYVVEDAIGYEHYDTARRVTYILTDKEFENLKYKVYPSEEEIIRIARETKGYLGIVKITCEKTTWFYEVLEDI